MSYMQLTHIMTIIDVSCWSEGAIFLMSSTKDSFFASPFFCYEKKKPHTHDYVTHPVTHPWSDDTLLEHSLSNNARNDYFKCKYRQKRY